MSNRVVSITDAEFASKVLDAGQPVLVYFWAAWCGPCRLMSPMMDWAAAHYSDRLSVVKMEIDPNPQTVAQFEVQGVPALILFRDGETLETIEGVVNKQKLESILTAHLPTAA
jgi:thioredoxin 1